ncbi:MAG: phosphate regulon sensor histidine kinase PhoR [Acidobacteria bacterium]|nr:phosphate regulon sensor histidine kinase PhoR [Acidobacteriota bacterium]
MTLRLQVFSVVLAISAMLLISLDVLLPGRLQPYLVEQFSKELKQEALLIKNSLETSGSDLQMREFANRIGSLLGRRVTIISPDGQVVGDNSADSTRMENHNARPEVQQARRSGFGQSVRHSNTLGRDMVYVAVPFRTYQGGTGIVRLSLEFSVIQDAREEVRHVIYWLSFLAFLASIVLAYLLSHGISRSAAAMAKTAKTVASGDLQARTTMKGPLELQVLGRALNQMTDRLVSQLQHNAAERQRLRTILEGMGEGVLMMDPHGNVEFINPACRQMLDLPGQVQGRKMIEVVRQLELEKAMHHAVTAKRSQKLELELQALRKDVSVNLYPILKESSVSGVVVVFQDVTELRRLENLRKDFVANVSHELRTPLTSIRGYAETLLSEADLDERTRHEFHSIIYKNATRLSALINDLLQLSSLESRRETLERETLDLREVAQSVLTSMHNSLADKKLKCSLVSDPEVTVQGNRRGLEQVFYNLLDNAIKYTPEGGSVDVKIHKNEGKIRVAIKDTGIGIPAEDLPRIFERFYRVDKSRSREMGGTGLGLSIVKHLVQLHGGTIEVESRPNEGSTFIFQLPIA